MAKSDRPTNIARHYRYEKGNVAAGFAKAKVVVEAEFDTATVHQGYIEPHNATAQWNADGHVTIWTSTQGAFAARDQAAGLLGIPVSRIKVVPMEIGGGFGGKIAVYLEPLAAVLSRKSGRPVKLVMDRTSVFEATGPTPASHIRVKIGADATGRITAAEAWLAYEAGAFPGSPINPGCMCVFACYDVPNGRVDGYDVVVNKPRTNAYRAPGATNAAMATETVIDEICVQLELDPLEFRAKNAAKEGTRRIDGPVFSRIGMAETVEAIRASEHWNSPLGGPNRGRGVASGFWFNAGLQSSATATVNTDGRVSLVEGSTDIGGSRTGIAMQLAETLGIHAEDITPTVADTDGVGYTDVTGGSRVTYATGWAAWEAGQDIRRQMVERAAVLWDVVPAQITYEDDGTLRGPDGRCITFRDLAAKLSKTGGPVTGRGISTNNKPGGAFATHVVDVEVDPETGKVTILRYTAAQDVGTAIHPSYVEGQIQGGVVQGIGWGAQRGIRLRRAGPHAKCQLSRLSHANVLRRAADRPHSGRSPQSRAPLRRPRRGRSADRAAACSDRQRDSSGGRRAHAAASDVAAAAVARNLGDSKRNPRMSWPMPRVFIPPELRTQVGGVESVDVPGKTVREVIDSLDAQFPGIGRHFRDGDSLRGGLTVVIDSDVSPRGLLQKVDPASEVHFLPAIGGG